MKRKKVIDDIMTLKEKRTLVEKKIELFALETVKQEEIKARSFAEAKRIEANSAIHTALLCAQRMEIDTV